MPSASLQNTGHPSDRIGALDGLRLLAIALIIGFHLDLSWMPSGHMGVIVFLTLSGYLFTSSLVKGLIKTHNIDYGKRIRKRIVRIWPSMMVMIIAVLMACTLFNHILLTKMRPDILPSSFFFLNLSYIIRKLSYFQALGAPSPLTHLWYLGLDFQFILIWPLLVYALVKLGGVRHNFRRSRHATLILAVASAVEMAVLFVPGQDPTRVYYGLDTRAFSLLLGCWLGYIHPLGLSVAKDFTLQARKLKVETLFRGAKLDLLGWGSLAVIVAVSALVPADSAFLYRGGMFLVSLLSVGVIAALLNPQTSIARILGLPALEWLGKRSFAWYLWHYPVILLLGAQTNIAAWWLKLLAVLLSLGLACLSHAFVEKRVDLASISSWFAKLVQDRRPVADRVKSHPLRIVAIAAVAIICGVGLFAIPDVTVIPKGAMGSTGLAADKSQNVKLGPAQLKAAEEAEARKPKQDPEKIPEGTIYLMEDPLFKKKGIYDPVLIGDSVPAMSKDNFKAHCDGILLDTYVGRRPDQMLQVLKEYVKKGVVGKVVILNSFSNTLVTDQQLDEAVSLLGKDRDIFLVTVHIPEKEQTPMNKALKRCADKYKNVHLIDWYAYSKSHSEWYYPDMTHPNPKGETPYVQFVLHQIAPYYIKRGGRVLSQQQHDDLNAKKEAAKGGSGTTAQADSDKASNHDGGGK